MSTASSAEPSSGRAPDGGRAPRRSGPWLWWPVVLYAGAIFAVSAMSQPPVSLSGGGTDKLAHSAAYAGFGVLTLRALAGAQWAGVTAARCLWAGGLAALYGTSDELHQRFVPGRMADVRDLAADVAGAAGGIAATWLLARVRRSGR